MGEKRFFFSFYWTYVCVKAILGFVCFSSSSFYEPFPKVLYKENNAIAFYSSSKLDKSKRFAALMRGLQELEVQR